MSKTPAVAFTEALCRKASEDGWKLSMDASHFMWAKGNDKLGAQSVSLDARYQLFTACVELDKAHYNLRVEL